MSSLLLKGGRIIDPMICMDMVSDILVIDGMIKEVAPYIETARLSPYVVQIDLSETDLVCPGLFDMHVHTRIPGDGITEDLDSVVQAALAGGFTGILAMPNTDPVVQKHDQVKLLYMKYEKYILDIYQSAAITVDQEGERLNDLEDLAISGVSAFTDDGQPVKSTVLLHNALKEVRNFDIPILLHCEDKDYSSEGVVSDSVSESLKVRGIPSKAESYYVYWAIKIAEDIEVPLHLQHISCKESVDVIRHAKAQGNILLTAETCPHYISLTTKVLKKYKSNAKMNPPLRTETDRQALIQGLKDGTIDVISTDHAPHTPAEKRKSLKTAPFGIIGLETAVPVIFTALEKHMDYLKIVEKLTFGPVSHVFNLSKRAYCERRVKSSESLIRGGKANITVIDTVTRKKVNANTFYSKGRNCPWNGKRLSFWPKLTIKNGEVVAKDGKVLKFKR